YPRSLPAAARNTLRRAAPRHADLWNIAGVDLDDAVARSALLDDYCRAIGRDPHAITRSLHVPVSYDKPDATRDGISRAVEAGFTHLVLSLPSPYPAGVAQWVVDEVIAAAGV